jgi:transposase
MKAFSVDLRQRVLDIVDRGMPRVEVVRLFQVSLASIKRYLKQRRETGSLAPRPRPGRPSVKGAALRAELKPQLAAHPDATLETHCRLWAEAHHPPVSTATMSRVISGDFHWTVSPFRQPSVMRRRGRLTGSGSRAETPRTLSSSTNVGATLT